MAGDPPGKPGPKAPLAIIGTAITLPTGIHTGEQFFDLIAAKRQVRRRAGLGSRAGRQGSPA